jgi:signal transduction histidine kinase/CheY-like chemotaxis protein
VKDFDSKANEERVLILAPMGRDGALTRQFLGDAGVASTVCADGYELLSEMRDGVGVILLTEEALTPSFVTSLQAELTAQPPWSDIPLVISAFKDSLGDSSTMVVRFAELVRNVTVLERPVRILTLFSLVRLALSVRRRQYEIRDILVREQQARKIAEEARAEADLANRSKDEFLAMLSHELRTPLNAVLGFSELLSYEVPGSKEFNDSLAAIVRNSRAQASLIDDILDVSRIVTGKLSIEENLVNVVGIVNEAVDSFRPAAEKKSVSILMMTDLSSATVLGDANRLRQIVSNLLSNAVKFTLPGGRITVEMTRKDSMFELAVADNGEGIASEFLPHAFEKFRQQDASCTRRFGGLGLGLSIVQYLVEVHKGSITVHSDGKGTGAKFTVRLPTVVEAATSEGTDEIVFTLGKAGREWLLPESLPVEAEAISYRFLVVDDQTDSRHIVARVLKRSGHEVVEADCAAAGRKAIAEGTFDGLFCDIGMPDEDGLSFIQSLRKLEQSDRRGLPAAALTGFASEEDKARALAAGFDLHLSKPVCPDDVLKVVNKLCSLRKNP